jgi:hypothetical protein
MVKAAENSAASYYVPRGKTMPIHVLWWRRP